MKITKDEYYELYNKILPYAKRWVRKFPNLVDRALEAEDLVSEGILKLIEGNTEINSNKEGYIKTLVFNKLKALHNQSKPHIRFINETKNYQLNEINANREEETIETAYSIIDYCRRNILVGVPPIDISLFLSYYLRTGTNTKWGESYRTLATETKLPRISVLRKITNLTQYLSYLVVGKFYIKSRSFVLKNNKRISTIKITKMTPNDYPKDIIAVILSAQKGYTTNFNELVSALRVVLPDKFSELDSKLNSINTTNLLKTHRKLLKQLVVEAYLKVFTPIVVSNEEELTKEPKNDDGRPVKRSKRNAK